MFIQGKFDETRVNLRRNKAPLDHVEFLSTPLVGVCAAISACAAIFEDTM